MSQVGQAQKHPEWRIIVDLVRAVDWGALVPHATIASATGLKPETVVYYRHIRQARKVLLRDHDIIIDTEAKEGYRKRLILAAPPKYLVEHDYS